MKNKTPIVMLVIIALSGGIIGGIIFEWLRHLPSIPQDGRDEVYAFSTVEAGDPMPMDENWRGEVLPDAEEMAREDESEPSSNSLQLGHILARLDSLETQIKILKAKERR